MKSIWNLSLLLAVTTSLSHAETYKIDPALLVNIRCGDAGSKLPTPTYGDKGIVFTICSERELQAPIAEVYNALLDFSRYSSWNTFVVDVQPQAGTLLPSGPAPLGTKVTFITQGLLGSLNTTSGEVVTIDLENLDGHAINGWRFDGFGQLAEHPNILTDLGSGRTRYVSYESYYGLLAPVTSLLKDSLRSRFEAQADDLKRLVES